MKRNLLSAILVIQVSLVSATVHTVGNYPESLAQFSTVQDAVDAATVGDTIYVHGSAVTYAGFTLSNKQLVILGPGWAPDKNVPLIASISGAAVDGTGSSGTEFQGIRFSGGVVFAGGQAISDIRIIRCHFTNNDNVRFSGGFTTTYSNFLMEGNWFENAQLRSEGSNNIYSGFLVQNNLFQESGLSVTGNFHGFNNTSNFVIDHNLFYGTSFSARPVFANNCRFLIISNNIFVRRDALTQNSFSTFTNNITYLALTASQPWIGNSNIDGGGNIAETNPQMTDQSGVNNGVADPLLDFSIASGPANNSGTDGKDLGLLFDATGSLNWNVSRSSRLPLITTMTITTPTVMPGGNISVTIESTNNN